MADLYVNAGIALSKALEEAAKLAGDTNRGAAVNLAYAQTANNLAEALAWLRDPGQSHGGGASTSN